MQNVINLTNCTTLKLPFFAQSVFEINHPKQLSELANILPHFQRYFILAGGSNTVAAPFFPGVILKMALKGKRITENQTHFFIHAAAGENWAEVVQFAHQNGIFGLENLAGIPGQIGAAVVQNIGAYGVEIKNFVSHVQALHLKTFDFHLFSNQDCAFGYRQSAFKTPHHHFLITEVCLQIPKKWQANLHYADLKKQLTSTATPEKILTAVLNARHLKLPDPKQLPNAGSFFKNPQLCPMEFARLQKEFPQLPFWPSENHFKISAAFLIEQAGLKGLKNAQQSLGIFAQHALIVVHYQNGSRAQLDEFTQFIQHKVQNRFGILLHPEPVFIPI